MYEKPGILDPINTQRMPTTPMVKWGKEKYFVGFSRIFERKETVAEGISFKGQIKAKDIFIDFDHLRPGDFKISNEISI